MKSEAQGLWEKAARYLETALFLASGYNNIEFESDLTRSLGESYSKMGNYKKSADYFMKYLGLKDSIDKLTSLEVLEEGN